MVVRTVKASKTPQTVTVTEEWKRHRDQYVKTGDLTAFKHMLESVTITTVTGDPNDTPTATR